MKGDGMKLVGDKWVYFLDGKKVTEKKYRKRYPPPRAGGKVLPKLKDGWPKQCLALAVHPDQVDEANARNKEHGISVHYDAKGVPTLPDRNERRKLLKLEGLHDRHSFTGY
jgi:hypothetical protein